jgi:two-component system, NarL family, response regulator NreC
LQLHLQKFAMLTPKELQVLNLVSKGFSTIDISRKLQISGYTVEGYRKDLLRKFRAKNSAELVRKAIKAQWLTVTFMLFRMDQIL